MGGHSLLVSLGFLAAAWASSGQELCVWNCTPQQDMQSLLQWNARSQPKFRHRKIMGYCRHHRTPAFMRSGPLDTDMLDPDTIDKFVTPLVIPPVIKKACKSGTRRKCQSDYDIAMLEFKQQILPGGIWNNPMFDHIRGGKTYNFPATQVWSYAPAHDPEPDSSALGGGRGIAPAPNSQVNYPAYTVENVRDEETTVNWINHLVKEPWKCNFKEPWKTYHSCKFIKHITTVDQSLHWANPNRLPCTEPMPLLEVAAESGANENASGKPVAYSARKKGDQDCKPANVPELKEPYRGPVPMVVHVHGGNTDADSDGYPEAWYMPSASNIPDGFAKQGRLVNKLGRVTNRVNGVANYRYPNNQPTTTLWYHDHTLGMTRNNVYAGPAGFWIIRKRDGGEDGLVSGILPQPAPKEGETLEETNLYPGRNKYREIPLVIQDRSFKNKGAELFYPEHRAFFEGLPVEDLQIPLRGDRIPSDVPRFWNPEAFFNVMLVNGVSWPVLEVEPDIYRFRILNGCNSRVLNLAMYTMNGEVQQTEVPFYQIGGDQSLLPKVVLITTGNKTALPGNGTIPQPTAVADQEALLIGNSERADVLIDFRNQTTGTVIRMFNTGPDDPFGGFPIEAPAAPDSSTGQIMEFRVIENTLHGDSATAPENLTLELPQAGNPANQPGTGDKVRDQALLEEESLLICKFDSENADGTVTRITWDPTAEPTEQLDGSIACINKENGQLAQSTPFGPTEALLGIKGSQGGEPTEWSDPIVTDPGLDDTETWEFWDWTVDAHPIHVHEVKFRVINRQRFNTTDGSLIGDPEDIGPTYAGWKDTVLAYPGVADEGYGYVTRIKAQFDRPGLYVWHCHVLEHEDNEMMVPFCIGDGPGCQEA